MEKWPFLVEKPLCKNVKFSTFWTSCFYSLERCFFFFLQYRKLYFSVLFCLKKRFEKWPFSDWNHGLTPLVKCQFFVFLNFLFFSVERRYFVLENRKGYFPRLYSLRKIKVRSEKWPFLDQNHRLTPLEKCQFFDFFNFLFL